MNTTSSAELHQPLHQQNFNFINTTLSTASSTQIHQHNFIDNLINTNSSTQLHINPFINTTSTSSTQPHQRLCQHNSINPFITTTSNSSIASSTQLHQPLPQCHFNSISSFVNTTSSTRFHQSNFISTAYLYKVVDDHHRQRCREEDGRGIGNDNENTEHGEHLE